MKNQKKNTKTIMTSADAFNELCSLTLNVCGKDGFPDGIFTPDGNRWMGLTSAWDILVEGGSAAIFVDAVHRIMWGIPSNQIKPEYDEIVKLVQAELLKDDEAFQAWDEYVGCDVAIMTVGDSSEPWTYTNYCMRYSIEHYHYLCDKMKYKIRYSKAKYRDQADSYKNECLKYENAIKLLIPAAKHWTVAYWYDENHIFDELVRLYGVDYREDYIEYGRLLIMLMYPEQDESRHLCVEAWCASNIKKLPEDLMKVIWPDDTASHVTLLFLTAANAAENYKKNRRVNERRKKTEIHPIGVFEYADIKNSWLYNTVMSWVCSEEDTDEIKDIKKALLNVAIRG